jgi:adenosylmethionine-8-amino-7-oxononanoate aminotransferase
MVCLENVADKATKVPLPDEAQEARRIAKACEAMGLLVRPMGHLNVMSPPLIVTKEQCDLIADTLSRAIQQVADELTREGWRLS